MGRQEVAWRPGSKGCLCRSRRSSGCYLGLLRNSCLLHASHASGHGHKMAINLWCVLAVAVDVVSVHARESGAGMLGNGYLEML